MRPPAVHYALHSLQPAPGPALRHVRHSGDCTPALHGADSSSIVISGHTLSAAVQRVIYELWRMLQQLSAVAAAVVLPYRVRHACER
jgi:hypothetical protein